MNQSFIDFFENYKVDEYYKSISEISKLDKDNPNSISFIENDCKLWDIDELCDFVNKELCGNRQNKPKLTSVDSLCYYSILDEFNNVKLRIFLIEFKRITLNKKSDKEIIKDLMDVIEKDHHNSKYKSHLSDLNHVKSFLGKEIPFKLRLKPLETVYSILPALCNIYSQNNSHDLIRHIQLNCDFQYIIVSNVNENLPIGPNNTNKHLLLKNQFRNLTKFRPKPFPVKLFTESDFVDFIETHMLQKVIILNLERIIEDLVNYNTSLYDLYILIPNYL